MRTYRYVDYFIKQEGEQYIAIIYFPGNRGRVASRPFHDNKLATEYIVDEIDAHWEEKKIPSQNINK